MKTHLGWTMKQQLHLCENLLGHWHQDRCQCGGCCSRACLWWKWPHFLGSDIKRRKTAKYFLLEVRLGPWTLLEPVCWRDLSMRLPGWVEVSHLQRDGWNNSGGWAVTCLKKSVLGENCLQSFSFCMWFFLHMFLIIKKFCSLNNALKVR